MNGGDGASFGHGFEATADHFLARQFESTRRVALEEGEFDLGTEIGGARKHAEAGIRRGTAQGGERRRICRKIGKHDVAIPLLAQGLQSLLHKARRVCRARQKIAVVAGSGAEKRHRASR